MERGGDMQVCAVTALDLFHRSTDRIVCAQEVDFDNGAEGIGREPNDGRHKVACRAADDPVNLAECFHSLLHSAL